MAEKYGLNYVYISEEPGCEVYVNTDSNGRWFSTRYIVYDDDETNYYDSFDDVMDDYDDFTANNVEELNECLPDNVRVYEYSSE